MIKKNFIFVSLAFGNLLYAQKTGECSMFIKSVKNDADRFILTIGHDSNCEILMDHNASHISLVSKPYTKKSPLLENDKSSSDTKVEKIMALASSKIGDSYEPAKAGPDHFDCSGFVYYVFTQNDIKIPRTSLKQSQSGEKIKREDLKRGDMVFFDTHERKHVNHSGIYLGEGKFIHSSSGKAYGVTISDIDKGFYKDKFRWGVRKVAK